MHNFSVFFPNFGVKMLYCFYTYTNTFICIFKLLSWYISNIIFYVLSKTPLPRVFPNYPT